MTINPLQQILDDPHITRIMVDAPDRIYVEYAGNRYSREQLDASFENAEHLQQALDELLETAVKVNQSAGVIEAWFSDGTRLFGVTSKEIATTSPVFIIKKPKHIQSSLDSIMISDVLSRAAAMFLRACVVGKLNILIVGGRDGGKTTLLNALMDALATDERIIAVQDNNLLSNPTTQPIFLKRRENNVLMTALQMQPDRLLVDDLRHNEIPPLLNAMDSGQRGTLVTMYADNGRDALQRLEASDTNRFQISRCIDLIIHISRIRDGRCRVLAITELIGVSGTSYVMTDLFNLTAAQGLASFKPPIQARMQATGVRPHCLAYLDNQGIELPSYIFQPNSYRKRISELLPATLVFIAEYMQTEQCGIIAGMAKAGELDHELGDVFRVWFREVSLGFDTVEAWQRMADRANHPDLRIVLDAISTAYTEKSDMLVTLHAQSERLQ